MDIWDQPVVQVAIRTRWEPITPADYEPSPTPAVSTATITFARALPQHVDRWRAVVRVPGRDPWTSDAFKDRKSAYDAALAMIEAHQQALKMPEKWR
jgi:hypothetical protein